MDGQLMTSTLAPNRSSLVSKETLGGVTLAGVGVFLPLERLSENRRAFPPFIAFPAIFDFLRGRP